MPFTIATPSASARLTCQQLPRPDHMKRNVYSTPSSSTRCVVSGYGVVTMRTAAISATTQRANRLLERTDAGLGCRRHLTCGHGRRVLVALVDRWLATRVERVRRADEPTRTLDDLDHLAREAELERAARIRIAQYRQIQHHHGFVHTQGRNHLHRALALERRAQRRIHRTNTIKRLTELQRRRLQRLGAVLHIRRNHAELAL